MDFLFHTIVYYNEKPVYYNVSRTSIGYFAEVVDNPHNVCEAIDFDLEDKVELDPAYKQYKSQIEVIRAEILLIHNGRFRNVKQNDDYRMSNDKY